ncbi:MAG TPA: zinc ribbon domain-containing protein [Gemmatimonadaceae bacterium]|nr:zinc ribbon domain-containing protein [Gemmatimonadaceae bacterium]
MSSTTTSGTTTCPHCSAPASGRFCASCGLPLEGAACAACHAPLSPGAKFCHRCGTPVGSAPVPRPGDAAPSGFPAALPWAVAAIALLALIALVAGQRFGTRPAPATAAASQEEGPPVDAGGPAPVRGPDISALSPRERADRLYDRIMRLDSEGKKDSVQFFAQMGISAYQMLPDQDLDTRYDMGRIAEVAGATPLARAQSDSILAADPNHLLGLILGISTAHDLGDKARADSLQRRLVAAQSSELAKNLPEYQRHQQEIAAAIDAARKK